MKSFSPHSVVIALAIALLPSVVHAQTIRGVVLESGGTEPIAGATIELLRADSTVERSVTSDRRGWFQFELELPGTYRLRPAHLSYATMRTDSVSVGKHEIVTVVLRMSRTAIALEPLVVAARSQDRLSGFYQRAETNKQGYFIRRAYIDSRQTARPTLLLMMTPGVRVVPSADGFSNVVMMRGPGGPCPAQVFLDGLPVPQELGMSIDDFTAAAVLEGVEIYPAYVPVPSGLPTFTNECGIIAFWSRRDAFRPFTWKKFAAALALGAIIVLTSR